MYGATLTVADLPIEVARYEKKVVAVGKAGVLNSLPFSSRVCTVETLSNEDEFTAFEAGRNRKPAELLWSIMARVELVLNPEVDEHVAVLCDAESGKHVGTVPFALNSASMDALEKQLSALSWSSGSVVFVGPNPQFSKKACESAQPPASLELIGAKEFDDNSQEFGGNSSVGIVYGHTASESAMATVDIISRHRTQLQALGESARLGVFWPHEMTYPVNVYSLNDQTRKQVYETLMLPKSPLLHWKQRCVHWFNPKQLGPSAPRSIPRNGQAWEKKLVRDPHLEIKVKGAMYGFAEDPDGAFVSGSYDYYHYKVDGFKDDGWGCAYRSLQTVLSWFQYAGWMQKPVPSVRLIQEILATVDPDKTNKPSFVGSQDWIGSYEVMLVLQHYLPQVECTIRRLERGDEMDTNAELKEQLMRHFKQRDACPMMIGGSNYAHTILGMAVDSANGEVRYAVLDPHYSSFDTDMKVVQSKGWLAWKPAAKFFNPESWYNICIPNIASYDPR